MTLTSAVYQRVTGPTYPVRGSYTLGGSTFAYRLPRSHAGPRDAVVSILAPNPGMTGSIRYRRTWLEEAMTEVPLRRDGDRLAAAIPSQPPAGRVEYQLRVSLGDGSALVPPDHPTSIRFKGQVHSGVLVAHVVFMFAGMMIAARAGIEALRGLSALRRQIWAAFVCLFVGGMALGPVVQYQAFQEYWTGTPYGWDLTDNKMLICILFWIVACVAAGVRTGPVSAGGRWLGFTAAVVTFVIFLIPHSTMGSEIRSPEDAARRAKAAMMKE